MHLHFFFKKHFNKFLACTLILRSEVLNLFSYSISYSSVFLNYIDRSHFSSSITVLTLALSISISVLVFRKLSLSIFWTLSQARHLPATFSRPFLSLISFSLLNAALFKVSDNFFEVSLSCAELSNLLLCSPGLNLASGNSRMSEVHALYIPVYSVFHLC